MNKDARYLRRKFYKIAQQVRYEEAKKLDPEAVRQYEDRVNGVKGA